MRTNVFFALFISVFCVSLANAQVRDLFAEFESEANESPSSSSQILSSSSVMSSAAQTIASDTTKSLPSEKSTAKDSIKTETAVKTAPLPQTQDSTEAASTNAAPLTSQSAALAQDSAASPVPQDSAALTQNSATPTPTDSVALAQGSATIVPADSTMPVPADSTQFAQVQDSTKLAQDSAASPVPQDSAALTQNSATSAPTDSVALAQDSATVAPADSAAPLADSSSLADSSQTPTVAIASSSSAQNSPSSSSVSRSSILGPVKVSKVHSMNELKGRYKSPRKALFMSLVIPGSGQLYVGGSTFTKVRGGAYLALEAGLWAGWYYFSVHRYNDQVKKYKKFAKQNFSIGQYEQKMHDIFYTLDGSDEEANFRTRYLSGRETYCESIYGNAGTNGCYDSKLTFDNDGNHTKRFDADKTLGEDLKEIKLYDAGDLYSQIAGSSYVLGWIDVTDETLPAELDLADVSAETVSLGKSAAQKKYRSMRSKANDYADMQAWFFGGIILNHLVSALDAALTANAHNKTLYEEKVSFLERVNLESYVMPFRGARAAAVNAIWSF